MTDPATHQSFAISRGDTTLIGDRWLGDGPTAVLIHAGVTDRRCWRDVAQQVANGATVVTYDCRGYGETLPTPGPFSHMDDLFAVLDEVADHAWLVGSSMGGRIALDAAISEPGRVAGLILLAPGISGAPEATLDADTQRAVTLMDEAEAAGDLGEVARMLTRVWLDGPSSPEGRVAGAARALAMDMIGIILRNNVSEDAENSGVDAWRRLDEIAVPTTVACGDLDLPHVIGNSRQLAERISGARHHLLPGMAHLPYLEDPGTVAQLIADTIAAG